MGMSIDVAKVNLHAIQVYYNDDMQDSYVGFDKEDNESIDFAIEIMQKYQKIEQIIDDWINEDSVGMSDYWMGKIREVIEDGNVD